MEDAFKKFLEEELHVQCGLTCEDVHPLIANICDEWADNTELDREQLTDTQLQISICSATEVILRSYGPEYFTEGDDGDLRIIVIMAVRAAMMTEKRLRDGSS